MEDAATLNLRNDSDSGEELNCDSDYSWLSSQSDESDSDDHDSSSSSNDSDEVGEDGEEQRPEVPLHRGGGGRNHGAGFGTARPSNNNNVSFNWELYEDTDRHTPELVPKFNQRRGVLVDTTGFHPVDYFNLFFPLTAVELIVRETNRYAHKLNEEQGDHSYSNRKWKKDADSMEIRAYMGLQIAAGLYPMPSRSDHWAQHWMHPGSFGKVISRDRYIFLERFLHFADNTDRPARGEGGHNPLFKIQPLLDEVRRTYAANFAPGQHLSIDQTIVPFKGKTNLKHFLPDGPHKWGFKAFILADSATKYCLDMLIYTDKDHFLKESKIATDSVGEKVVMTLMHSYMNKGHIIYTGRLYTSPTLCHSLMTNHGTGLCGVCDATRKGFPDILKEKNLKLKKHDPPVYARCGDMVCVAWHDRKQINLLSSVHANNSIKKRVKTKRGEGGFHEVEKPVIADCYNSHKSGVDSFNQRASSYSYPYRSYKWYKPIYHFLRETAVVNAYILYCETTTNPKPAKTFRQEVVDALVKPLMYLRQVEMVEHHSNIASESRLIVSKWDHFPHRFTDEKHRPRCRVCTAVKRRVQTRIHCPGCGMIPLCAYPCFRIYHTCVDYVKARKDFEEQS